MGQPLSLYIASFRSAHVFSAGRGILPYHNAQLTEIPPSAGTNADVRDDARCVVTNADVRDDARCVVTNAYVRDEAG